MRRGIKVLGIITILHVAAQLAQQQKAWSEAIGNRSDMYCSLSCYAGLIACQFMHMGFSATLGRNMLNYCTMYAN